MPPYQPPLQDLDFILTHLIGFEKLTALPGLEAMTGELVHSVLEAAGQLAADIFAPLNVSGDRTGARFSGGEVTMPPGFGEAWAQFRDGGWNGLPVEERIGGQGLPWCVAGAVNEMLQSANLSLALCALLNQGAIEAITAHGSEEIKAKFLPKLVSGAWTGTMNLTEPQAGSDVGAVRTKAVLDESSPFERYLIQGQKIFISYGEHDLASNILHLVLARLPDAPPGTKGLSLFLVPKFIVEADGSLGERNDVRAVSIEHKLGQHASPTCVMAYGDQGGAIGYLIGDLHGGMAAMFTMMNNARIGVGVQGLGLMERSYQHAVEIARARIQGRPLGKSSGGPVAIVQHGDVKRMLLQMRACTEAARALAMMAQFASDLALRMPGPTALTHRARVDLLTPIVKSWITDLANDVTSIGVQIAGGMGFIEETGLAQHMRDARVLAIYEGTNGIQANDLVFRKLLRDEGAAFKALYEEILRLLPDLAELRGDDAAALHKHLSRGVRCLGESGDFVLKTAREDPERAAAVASPFLRLCGLVTGGYYLARGAAVAQQLMGERGADRHFLSSKIVTARFFAEHLMVQTSSLLVTILEGSANVAGAPSEMF